MKLLIYVDRLADYLIDGLLIVFFLAITAFCAGQIYKIYLA